MLNVQEQVLIHNKNWDLAKMENMATPHSPLCELIRYIVS